jgi:hypothetical protein
MDSLFIERTLEKLAERRPVFHSEADLQFEFAWEMRKTFDDRIRLEYPMRNIGELDIFLPDLSIIIEFKYKTKKDSFLVNGESFTLKQQSANPLGRYDFLKDVSRIETSHMKGFCIFLTNDPSYWKPDVRGNGKAFSLESDRTIHGTFAWQHKRLKSIGGNRMKDICLNGTYQCCWKQYSENFRFLLFSIKN